MGCANRQKGLPDQGDGRIKVTPLEAHGDPRSGLAKEEDASIDVVRNGLVIDRKDVVARINASIVRGRWVGDL